MRPPRSIRLKLISLYGGLLFIVFIAFGGFIYWSFHQFAIRELDRTLTRRAQQIAVTILEELPTRGEAYVASEIQARYAPELNERVMRIADDKGRTIYASRNANELSGIDSVVLQSPRTVQDYFLSNGATLRVVTIHHSLANGTDYLVQVGAPESEIALDLHDLLLTLGIVSPLLLFAAVVGGYFLLGRALKPVDQIVASAERITLKNLSERLPVPSTGDEFERISHALNRMIARLDEAFQIASRFSADASHEIRTPLTIIRGELEALARNQSLAGEMRERMGDILEEVERLGRIIEGLLLVSRLEAGAAQLHREPVNLGKLTQSIVEQMELLSAEKLLTVKCVIASDIVVEGDRSRLEQVVVNLLDNAIKYTPEGGNILLTVSANENHALFNISDTGIGIPPAALPHVFDRFFRAVEVRAQRTEGSGLGLSIVRSIIEAHGGTAWAESNGSGGTRIGFDLPLQIPPKGVKAQEIS
jgi:heavy metal sensor kinase